MRVAVEESLDINPRQLATVARSEREIFQRVMFANEAPSILLLIVAIRGATLATHLIRHALDVATCDAGNAEECGMTRRDRRERVTRIHQCLKYHMTEER